MADKTRIVFHQTEVTEPTPLLDKAGRLLMPGYGKKNHFIYNKEQIGRRKWRLKEWDYYQFSDGRYMVQMNFFNISLMAAFTVKVCDLKTGREWSDMAAEPLTMGKYPLSESAEADFDFIFKKGKRIGEMHGRDHKRLLTYRGTAGGHPLNVKVCLRGVPGQESLTVATPFKQKGRFFYTQKLNCLRVEGEVSVGGHNLTFTPERTFGVIDWGRGVWPYASGWFWSNGSTVIDGKLFGFELTWGIGIEKYATETALFYDGKCHKIGPVRLTRDPQKGGKWMSDWHFVSEDGRLDLTMTPFYHHRSGMVFMGLLGMKSHQLHGLFNGHVILDDGTRLEIRHMYAFAEKVKNRW